MYLSIIYDSFNIELEILSNFEMNCIDECHSSLIMKQSRSPCIHMVHDRWIWARYMYPCPSTYENSSDIDSAFLIISVVINVCRKRNEFFVFYWFENTSTAHNFVTTDSILVTTDSILVEFSAKCTSPKNEHFQQIETWKCHMLDFRLISLDRIT